MTTAALHGLLGTLAGSIAASALIACSSPDAAAGGAAPVAFRTPDSSGRPMLQAESPASDPTSSDPGEGATSGAPSADATSDEGPPPGVIRTDMLGTEAAAAGAAPSDPPSSDSPATEMPVEPTLGRLGTAMMGGSGQSAQRYATADITRDARNYFFMANGWGPGFQSQTISWNGTSFTVEAMQGTPGPNFEPATYPTVFCGAYSDAVSGECGLPAAIDSLAALETGWSWRPNGNDGEYNAAYDIWLGTGPARNTFSGYLMVWYREPVGQQPAGRRMLQGVSVANVPGLWDVWTGTVGTRPIINWVRAEGADTLAMEFDVLDLVRDAQARGLQVPGTHVLSVAVGFEIWSGPIINLESVDFFVDAQPR
jgi:hypothetical protein